MRATTIKLEDPILTDLKQYIPPQESLSSYVRKVLEKEIRRNQMVKAAEMYRDFLEKNPDEKEEMGIWENAPLEKSVRKKGKSK